MSQGNMTYLMVVKNDPLRKQLYNTIKHIKGGWRICGEAINKTEFFQLIDKKQPDLVIFDMDEFDPLVILNSARKRNSKCSFLAFCSQNRFEYAQYTLKIDILLSKPIAPEYLYSVLSKITLKSSDDKIQHYNITNTNSVTELLFEIIRSQNNPGVLNLDNLKNFLTQRNINRFFGRSLQNGIFQFLCIHFDFFDHRMNNSQLWLIQEKCMEVLKSKLIGMCYDYFYSSELFQCKAVLNYSEKKGTAIMKAVEQSLKEMKNIISPQGIMEVTISLSQKYKDIEGICNAANEAMDAIWLRFKKGIGQVLCWEKEIELPAPYLKIYDNYRYTLKKACRLFNLQLFSKTLRAFCSLPKHILLHKGTRLLLQEISLYMYNINRDFISCFSDVDIVHDKIREANLRAVTLEEYFDNYTFTLTSLFKQIVDQVPKHSKIVRRAHFYVDQNLNKAITLTEAACEIGLNSVYFSRLYKKTTGENFTDYVKRCKISAAKNYLTNEKIKILDVALMTGFSNPKYFAKTFKKIVGMTPFEYRKMSK
jgi:YesN/AraC family two-component response regulator